MNRPLLATLALLSSVVALGEGSVPERLREADDNAPELEAAPATQAAQTPSASRFNYRGYLVAELGWLTEPKVPGVQRTSAIGEGNLSATLTPWSGATLFADGLLVATMPQNTLQPVLAQGGLRLQPEGSALSFALGRERNFRAPGLLVNPSDFVHPAQTVPGQRMQRAGVWLTRASYQTQKFTVDAFFLPFRALDSGGIPSSVAAEDLGGVGRAYVSLLGVDVGLTAGYFDRAWQAGLSTSRYIAKALEMHTEWGYRSAAGARALLGARIDVGSTGSLTAEGYFNGQGLSHDSWAAQGPALIAAGRAAAASGSSALSGSATSQLNLFPRQWYAIVGYSASELWQLFNASATAVMSLEDASGLAVLRWEWLVSGRTSLALLGLGLWGGDAAQYGARPIDGRFALEWRINL